MLNDKKSMPFKNYLLNCNSERTKDKKKIQSIIVNIYKKNFSVLFLLWEK